MFIQKLCYKDTALEHFVQFTRQHMDEVFFKQNYRTKPATVLKDDSIADVFGVLQFFRAQKTIFIEPVRTLADHCFYSLKDERSRSTFKTINRSASTNFVPSQQLHVQS